ncbi:HNH endonuclease [Ureaplasma canigenitalium]|uniref:HNH endonuclease n=1 Tax=Ureaplasma canigenitalium TaxID=42092 RepID=UPI0004E246A7|nr:HNH endonuclease [Ureaplasma canigenitalium]
MSVLLSELLKNKINPLIHGVLFSLIVDSTKIKRISILVEIVHQLKPNLCSGCNDQYNLEERTFISRKTNDYYLEVHHNISLANGNELDDVNNMVKLCPVCHACLKRNRGLKEVQKNIIKSILRNNIDTLQYSARFFDLPLSNTEQIVDEIYNHLA